MTFGGRYATALLFVGDIIVFVFSLWLTLLVRYAEIPSAQIFGDHIAPFAILFAFWALTFYMAGLYSKRVILFKSELPNAILKTQILNIVLAALFFFFIPGIGIAPKANLVLYLVLSLILIFIWRLALFPQITRPHTRERTALVGSGPEVEELVKEVNGNPRYHLFISVVRSPEELAADFDGFAKAIEEHGVSMLIIDTDNDDLRPYLSRIYDLAFVSHRYQFADFHHIYEEVFDRVPLSLLQYDWFLKNVSSPATGLSTVVKRLIDIVGGIVMGIVTLIALPFVFLALRLEGPGPVFTRQLRIGQHGERVHTYKFRSMAKSDSGAWIGEGENHVTRVGAFLRKVSLDEFPQFINILKGEISLIGPRNDIEGLGIRLAEEIPYYTVRYVVKPGITGWAQINQQYEPGNISPQSIEETKRRLAYDFYYIKNQSLGLDIVIALKTVKRMFFRVSSW